MCFAQAAPAPAFVSDSTATSQSTSGTGSGGLQISDKAISGPTAPTGEFGLRIAQAIGVDKLKSGNFFPTIQIPSITSASSPSGQAAGDGAPDKRQPVSPISSRYQIPGGV